MARGEKRGGGLGGGGGEVGGGGWCWTDRTAGVNPLTHTSPYHSAPLNAGMERLIC